MKTLEITTVVEKEVVVPENRKLHLDITVPDDLPQGKADIKVIVITGSKKEREELKAFWNLAGSLADSPTFEGDAAQLVREMRDNEW